MNRFGTLAAVFCGAAILCGGLLTGCTGGDASVGNAAVTLAENDETHIVIEVGAGDAGKSVYDALCALRDDGQISFDGSGGAGDFYLTSLNGKAADESHFWAVYTSVGTVDGVAYSDAGWGTYDFDGTTLASAAWGVSLLPLFDDACFAIVWTQFA